jgi:hypothetical protein
MENKTQPKPPVAGIIYGTFTFWIVILGVIIAIIGSAMYLGSDGYMDKETMLDKLWNGDDIETIWSSSTEAETTALRYDGAEWAPIGSDNSDHLGAIWADSPANIFAVGADGVILHDDGTGWNEIETDNDNDLNGIWGSSLDDIFSVGNNGVIAHFDGTSWGFINNPSEEDLNDIWGASASDIYAVGKDGTIVHYNGSLWAEIEIEPSDNLNAVWGSSSDDIFADWPVSARSISASGRSFLTIFGRKPIPLL